MVSQFRYVVVYKPNVNKDLIVKYRHAIDLLFLSMFLCECQPQQYKRWGIGLQCIYTRSTKRSFEPTCMNRSLYYVTAVLDEDLSTDNDCEKNTKICLGFLPKSINYLM